jgi:outer membrane lipoprotein SlyB
VNISGTTGVGGATGTASGAIIGSAASGGNGRGSALGTIAGAVAGGLVGAAIESNAAQQGGNEYVLQTENGNLMTIVQGLDPLFSVGQRVLILYGSPARIIKDPRLL